MSQVYEADRVTATIEKMVHCAKILGLPIIANTQYKKGLDPMLQVLKSWWLMFHVPIKLILMPSPIMKH